MRAKAHLNLGLLKQLVDATKRLTTTVMDAKAKNGAAGVTHDQASDVDQPVAQLFDPAPPRAVQILIFEDRNQVVGQKLPLKENRIGQEIL